MKELTTGSPMFCNFQASQPLTEKALILCDNTKRGTRRTTVMKGHSSGCRVRLDILACMDFRLGWECDQTCFSELKHAADRSEGYYFTTH